MNRIPASDGSADDVLWFEQSLKPSDRPQLVARLLKALSDPGKQAIQSKTLPLSKTWSFNNRRLESFRSLILKTGMTTTSSNGNGWLERPWPNGASGPTECTIGCCLPWNERLEGKPRLTCATVLLRRNLTKKSRGIQNRRRPRRHSICWNCKVSSVADTSKVNSICQKRDVSSNIGRVWNDQYSMLTSGNDRSS